MILFFVFVFLLQHWYRLFPSWISGVMRYLFLMEHITYYNSVGDRFSCVWYSIGFLLFLGLHHTPERNIFHCLILHCILYVQIICPSSLLIYIQIFHNLTVKHVIKKTFVQYFLHLFTASYINSPVHFFPVQYCHLKHLCSIYLYCELQSAITYCNISQYYLHCSRSDSHSKRHISNISVPSRNSILKGK